MLCKSAFESNDNLFFTVMELVIFGIGCFGWLVSWVCPESVFSFLQLRVRGFGREKDANFLWEYRLFAILWCTWIEEEFQYFSRSVDIETAADKVVDMALLWALARGSFREFLFLLCSRIREL